ncbi:unnamed protein product [Albugo candida]|nr:unnamed protein product [Albugo candida]|eukprot:CCI48625.1 unnamed protein product [Albugo candida]
MPRVQVNGTYRSDTVMECILPDLTQPVHSFLTKCTNSATTTEAVRSSPYLVPVDIFVTLDECVSNSMIISLHQEIRIRKVSPLYILTSAPVSICTTINLTSEGDNSIHPQCTTRKGENRSLDNITTLPVFVRVRCGFSKNGEAPCEQIREATWKVSALGAYNVIFPAPLLGIGVTRIQVSFTRKLFFPSDEMSSVSRQYVVHNEVHLDSIEPPCIVFNSGISPVIKIRGQGFVDSGEITLCFQQKGGEKQRGKREGNDTIEQPSTTKMSGTLFSGGEIHCTGLRSSFGLAKVYVSFNNGQQYSKEMLPILVCRERNLFGTFPRYLSLKGDDLVKLHVSRLPSDATDCWEKLREIRPSGKLYVELQGRNRDGIPNQFLRKRVPLDSSTEMHGANDTNDPIIYQFRFPSFFQHIEPFVELERNLSRTEQCNDSDRANQFLKSGLITFSCSVMFGASLLAGDIDLESYIPPIITSVIHQHGPSTGETSVFLSMKYQVPQNIPITVKFQSAFSDMNETTSGIRSNTSIHGRSVSEFIDDKTARDEIKKPSNYGLGNPDFTVACSSPAWQLGSVENSHLTLVQISYNGGYDFYPILTRTKTMDKTSTLGWKLVFGKVKSIGKVDTIREPKQDLTFLQFLYYRNPIVSMLTPISADQKGGTVLSLMGSNIIDHGHIAIVRFTSPELSECVPSTFMDGQLRCIAPPFRAGYTDISITFNSEQYDDCDLTASDSTRQGRFLYYETPSITSCRPRCLCTHKSSILRLLGTNFVETGSIMLSFHSQSTNSFKAFSHKVKSPGRLEAGSVICDSPLLASELAGQNLSISIALNGVDFMDTGISLYCFSSYKIIQVDPKIAVKGLPIALTLYLDQKVESESILLQVQLLCQETSIVHLYGPIQADFWEENCIRFEFPAIDSIISPIHRLSTAHVAISFDGQDYHQLGDLLQHFEVSVMPQVYNVFPLCGLYNQDTVITARSDHLKKFDGRLQLYITLKMEPLEGLWNTDSVVHVETSLRLSSDAEDMLTWICPSIIKVISRDSNTEFARSAVQYLKEDSEREGQSIILKPRLHMQLCINEGQHLGPSTTFRYLRLPRLISMSPMIGFVTPGCIIALKFQEPLDHTKVFFRFTMESSTADTTCSFRDEENVRNVLECRTPFLVSGRHWLSISLNGQDFSLLHFYRPGNKELKSNNEEGINQNTDHALDAKLAQFIAYKIPMYKEAPSISKKIIGSGTVDGQTTIQIHGNEFISNHPVYVRFYAALSEDNPVCGSCEAVEAILIDSNTIECNSPPSSVPGLVEICISYNLQQYASTLLYFEYHLAPVFKNRGEECGNVKGGTRVVVSIENEKVGLPANKSVICPVFRFQSCGNGRLSQSSEVTAMYDASTHTMSCVAPTWRGNALVQIFISLTTQPFTRFLHTGIYFVYYDHPEGSMKLLPAAGPITGGTNVHLHCGHISGADEWAVQITPDAANGSINRSGGCVPGKRIPTTCDEMGLVHFETPATRNPYNAQISLLVHGINITSAHTRSLRFTYFLSPIVHQIWPPWVASDTALTEIVLLADNIRDFGCSILARLETHVAGKGRVAKTSIGFSKDGRKDEISNTQSIIVPAVVDYATIQDDIRRERGRALVRCNVSEIQILAGYYEIELSLNEQQYSQSAYTNASVANYSGLPCTSPNPFRVFSAPFFLATHLGPMAGGPTITIFFSKRVGQFLAKENKCQLQFLPISKLKGESFKGLDEEQSKLDTPVALYVPAEIDHKSTRIVCKAPSFRNNCKVEVDIIMSYASVLSVLAAIDRLHKNELTASITLPPPGTASCSILQMFGSKENDKYCTYQSPSISEMTPSCGPTKGNTLLVIQGHGIIDTGQVFVRFRSSSNERDLVLVPGKVSLSFPNGETSKLPVILCETPSISWSEIGAPITNIENSYPQEAPIRCLGRARTHMSVVLASCSLQRRNESVSLSNKAVHTLHLTRADSTRSTTHKSKSPGSPVAKDGSKSGDIKTKTSILHDSSHLVLVDFTLNAGEQFITHSVPFYYYTEPETTNVKWSPREFPSQTTHRYGSVNRILTVKFPPQCYPSALNDNFGGRIAVWFDGLSAKITSECYDTSTKLHDNDMNCHLCTFQISHRKGSCTSPIRLEPTTTSTTHKAMEASSTKASYREGGADLNTTESHRPDRNKPIYYIAASSSRAQEITCNVPEFFETGNVRVLFSFNAQQFIYLGDLGIHQPLYIEQHEAHRYCSCLGSEPFRLKSSISSLLSSIPAHDISNQVSLSRERNAVNNVIRCQAAEDTVLKEKETSFGGARGLRLNTWRKRTYQQIRVHLALAKSENEYGKEKYYKKKIIVSVCRTSIDHVISSKSVDDEGECVFESSDWTKEIHLHAQVILDAVSSEAAFTEYSASYAEFYRDNQPPENSENGMSHPIDIILLQRTTQHICQATQPIRPSLYVALKVFSTEHVFSQVDVKLIITNEKSIMHEDQSKRAGKTDDFICQTEAYNDATLNVVKLDVSQLASSPFVIGVAFRFDSSPSGLCSTVFKEVQVIVYDSCTTFAYFTLEEIPTLRSSEGNVGSCIWMVAKGSVADKSSLDLLKINEFGSSWRKWTEERAPKKTGEVIVDSALLNTASKPSCKKSNVLESIMVQFSGSTATGRFSIEVPGRLIFPEKFSLSTLMSEQNNSETYKMIEISCVPPSTLLDGYVSVSIMFQGVRFSNTLLYQCYDPRKWAIKNATPSLIVHGSTSLFRLQGGQFIDTGKICARIVDLKGSQVLDVRADMERTWSIYIRSVSVRQVKESRLSNCGLSKDSLNSTSDVSGATLADTRPSSAHPATTYTKNIDTRRLELLLSITYGNCKVVSSSVREVNLSMGGSNIDLITPALLWDESFELQAENQDQSLIISLRVKERSDNSGPNNGAISELVRSVLSIKDLASNELYQKSVPMQQVFKPSLSLSNTQKYWTSSLELDLAVQVSVPVLNTNCLSCRPDFRSSPINSMSDFNEPYPLYIQIFGENDHLMCADTRNVQVRGLDTDSPDNDYAVAQGFTVYLYRFPVIYETIPCVLPRSTGGHIRIRGSNFMLPAQENVVIRLFGCKSTPENEHDLLYPTSLLESINVLSQPHDGTNEFLIFDIKGVVSTSTELTCEIPAFLSSFRVFFRVSLDGGITFSQATKATQLLLFSVDKVEPCAGPNTGKTYAALCGTNINACLSFLSTWIRKAHVRLKWMKNGRELERKIITAEHYSPEDIVYFHTPQSPFRLENLSLQIELCLGGVPQPTTKRDLILDIDSSDEIRKTEQTPCTFSLDGALFYTYRSPTIKSITPVANLLPGITGLEMVLQGIDEIGVSRLSHLFRARFCCRGQMQTSGLALHNGGRMTTILPRFNVRNATSVELVPETSKQKSVNRVLRRETKSEHCGIISENDYRVQMYRVNSTLRKPQRLKADYMKRSENFPPTKSLTLWTRKSGLVVCVVRGHKFRPSEKGTCNSFVIINCGKKEQLRTTRRDGSFDPVWNEVLEFDAACLDTSQDIAKDGTPMQEVMLYISIYNQVNDQHCETLGSIDLLLSRVSGESFTFRGSFSIHRSSSKYQSQKINDLSTSNVPSGVTPYASQNYGMLELSIIFVPQARSRSSYAGMMQLAASKTLSSAVRSRTRSSSTFLKRDSENHGATSRSNDQIISTRTQTGGNKNRKKSDKGSDNERLARIFTSNLSNFSATIPTEISAEMALNGQDFSSVAPIQCYMVPPPLIVGIEPSLISINGGTTLTITGMNFVATGNIKVAFSLLNSGPSSLDCVAIVNAKLRSNTVITCVTPSFTDRTYKRMIIYLYISLNGFDFDSIKLPRNSFPSSNLVQAHDHNINQHDSGQKKSVSRIEASPVSWDDGRYGRYRYTLDTQALHWKKDLSCWGDNTKESNAPILQQQLVIYPRPEIDIIQYVDCPDGLTLRMTGRNFIDSASAVAIFTLTDNPKAQHSTCLQIKSEVKMECQLPESIRHGITVYVKISFNGQEFISYEKPLVAQHRTRILRLIPSWISLKSLMSSEESDTEKICLRLPGINICSPEPSLKPTTAVVSFQMDGKIFYSVATLSDNEVQCFLPFEVIRFAKIAFQRGITESMVDEASFAISALVDFSPDGQIFIGKPLILSIHKEPPIVSGITPSNGPIYGGSTVTIDGKGFINTGEISVRFSLLQSVPNVDPDEKKDDRRNAPISPREACLDMRIVTSVTRKAVKVFSSKKQRFGNSRKPIQTEKENASEFANKKTSSIVKKTDSVSYLARFVSNTCITCTTSSFASEGIYQVSVTLNDLEYSEVNFSSRFLVWQSWQRKRQMLSSMIANDAATTLLSKLGANLGFAEAHRDHSIEMSPRRSVLQNLEQSVTNKVIFDEKKLADLLKEVTALCKNDVHTQYPVEIETDLAETHGSVMKVMQTFSESLVVHMHTEEPLDTFVASNIDLLRDLYEKIYQDLSQDAFIKVMRHYFPRSSTMTLDKLWQFIEQHQTQKTGNEDQSRSKRKNTILYKDKTCAESAQSERNEPGPASYDPSYANVEIRNPSALILPKAIANAVPPTSPPRETIDHENAVQFIKPRIPQIFISKRNYLTSWCNPLPKSWNDLENGMILRTNKQSAAKVQASHMSLTVSSAKKIRCPERPLQSDQNVSRSNRGTAAGRNIVSKAVDRIAQAEFSKGEDIGDIKKTLVEKCESRPPDAPFLQDIAPMYTRLLRR